MRLSHVAPRNRPSDALPAEGPPASLRLGKGSRVAVIGGGPAGTFFSYFLLQIARRVGLDLEVEIYEHRNFDVPGPRGCNMCGGIVSESLVQSLATEGIHLPQSVIQRRIDSYFLHMDVGSVRIQTPLQEKRIAAVHRGSGPRGIRETTGRSFDAFLLDLAVGTGARRVAEKVERVGWDATAEGGRPSVTTSARSGEPYDLVAVTTGVNVSGVKQIDIPGLRYHPPRGTRAYICEFYIGVEEIKRTLGSSMHVFLLDIPRLEFAAVIPKTDYATICLLGEDIDHELVERFLGSEEVKACMPANWRAPDDFCHCSPKINVGSAVEPFGDRMVWIGDCATTRLYKDGIGAAYRCAKSAAVAAVFEGISAESFRSHYWPTCSSICSDNALGRFVFGVTRRIRSHRLLRRGLLRMVRSEQEAGAGKRRMSTVLWDTFTGSAPYRSVLGRTFHPLFAFHFLGEIATGAIRPGGKKRKRSIRMATGASGLMGKKFREGDIIVRQGDRGDCMYVLQGGRAEIFQRKGETEIRLGVLEDGDFFGEMALFGEETRTATVRAMSEVFVFTLERVSLLRRIHEDPSLAFRIIDRMANRIRELEKALVRQAEGAAS